MPRSVAKFDPRPERVIAYLVNPVPMPNPESEPAIEVSTSERAPGGIKRCDVKLKAAGDTRAITTDGWSPIWTVTIPSVREVVESL
jgi:hypothetical protein